MFSPTWQPLWFGALCFPLGSLLPDSESKCIGWADP